MTNRSSSSYQEDRQHHPEKCLSCLVHPPTGRLENWSSTRGGCLYGEIFDDKMGRFPDGKVITTSPVKELDEVGGHARTTFSIYILGKKAPKQPGRESL